MPSPARAAGFSNHDTEFSVQYALSGWEPLGKPLLLKGGFGVHAWDGPPVTRSAATPSDTVMLRLVLVFRWPGGPALRRVGRPGHTAARADCRSL